MDFCIDRESFTLNTKEDGLQWFYVRAVRCYLGVQYDLTMITDIKVIVEFANGGVDRLQFKLPATDNGKIALVAVLDDQCAEINNHLDNGIESFGNFDIKMGIPEPFRWVFE